MTCQEFNAMLDNYESLTDTEKLAMNEHAGGCEKCREELDFMLAIINQLNTLPGIEPPADFGAKLNKRLDAEAANGALAKILTSVRRNYRQYSTVAACLVLAVIIGANGKTLLDRIEPDTDGRVVVSTSAPSQPAATETAKIAEAVNNAPVNTADNAEPVKSAPVKTAAKTNTRQSAEIEHIRDVSESIKDVEVKPADKAIEPAYDSHTASEQSVAVAQSVAEPQNTETYTIARGVYRLPDPEIAQAELEAPKKREALQISEMGKENEATIARGRYYIPADEGYIAIDANNAIGVNSEDAKRAEELIKQYADEIDESYYVINSENIASMLEHMDGEGIDYQNNVENFENQKVSFKLVIE